jgi:predicted nucleic acid-binding Zn ribbon protein
LLSAPSFRLKGGGWYETDFKKENQRNIVKSDSDNDKKKTSNKKEDSGSKVKDNSAKNSPKTESKKTKSSK